MTRPGDGHDRLAAHVALEQIGDIAYAEAIRVRHQGSALKGHKTWRSEAQRREALQVVRIPLADVARPEDRLVGPHEPREIARVDDLYVEAVPATAAPLVAVRRDLRAKQ